MAENAGQAPDRHRSRVRRPSSMICARQWAAADEYSRQPHMPALYEEGPNTIAASCFGSAGAEGGLLLRSVAGDAQPQQTAWERRRDVRWGELVLARARATEGGTLVLFLRHWASAMP